MDLRTGAASLGFGILGAGINGLLLYAVTNLFKVYPPLNMGISLPVGMASGFVISSPTSFMRARGISRAGSLAALAV